MTLERCPDVRFLSELYALEGTADVLLAEYPSSNSDQTRFQNRSKYIIHDPFPPPRRELMKVLGPHHLMCGWGNQINVCSEVPPPSELTDHWKRVFGEDAVPSWQAFDPPAPDTSGPAVRYHTLFPHQSIPAKQQVVDPATNYAVHSKEVIQKIDCAQADVLDHVVVPCMVKLSHGYAGLGNFPIRKESDELEMRQLLDRHWPDATLVINSMIENICGDYGVQFFLNGKGSITYLGVTEQHFDQNNKWCGGSFSAGIQDQLCDTAAPIIQATGRHLHAQGYVGLVGIDILQDTAGRYFLVDVNPRLTGISPFLMNSRILAKQGFNEGVYRASVRTKGTIQSLISNAERAENGRVVILSVFEEPDGTGCVSHMSANSDSLDRCNELLDEIQTS